MSGSIYMLRRVVEFPVPVVSCLMTDADVHDGGDFLAVKRK